MALEAGVRLIDLEFVQFYSTALYLPGQASFLISEAVRGEGAHLLSRSGKRFMVARHSLAELLREIWLLDLFLSRCRLTKLATLPRPMLLRL